ncbi:short-subunit dehydrogenase [Halospina denitrificans]|uniref:Short-subunit dehydrogenase n=1 Tax=Halospina denitrificans TaxID=332522 RepID=A0A4R7JQ43_9GAMM|nr:SDR family NAD(P)-dependent oxidoreductase [Halospina denitrificans]TDT40291.1 short-subunit dehydrogenase [Halospina denitrificans]
MKSFSGKVAAITGAGSGIGRALALALSREGCHLALSDVNAEGLAETARQCEADGITVTTANVDVSNKQAVHKWADSVVKDHGRVNLVINNAGVAHAGSVEGSSYDDYDWILDINLRGVLYGTKAFLPHLKQAKDGGHIVNISSIFGLFSQPGMSAYNMTKFAVRGFTESLRQELDLEGANVSATCVHPGGIRTNIARSARMDNSVQDLMGGESNDQMQASFEKLFRTTADQAAAAILKGVRQNRRRVLIGPDARAADWMQRVLPTGYQTLVTTALKLNRRKQGGTHASNGNSNL